MTNTTAPQLNRYGFPIVTCYRCSGTGSYGPLSVEGGRCFECRGHGVVVRRGNARKAWAAFVDAKRAAVQTTVLHVNVGDEIRGYYAADAADESWRTVASIEIGVASGREYSGTGYATAERAAAALVELTLFDGQHAEIVVEGSTHWLRVYTAPRVLHFTDGSSDTMPANVIVRRRGVVVDPAPFLAQFRVK